MPVELLYYIIIALLVFDIAVTARVAMVSQQMRDVIAKKPTNGKPTDSELIVQMADRVAGIEREMLPKDGATMSYRINELNKYVVAAATAASEAVATARSSIEESRSIARTASDERSRIEHMLTRLQNTTETLLVATARATEAAVKIIQNTVQGTQSTVEATNSKIDQLAAGTDMAQTIAKTNPAVPIEIAVKANQSTEAAKPGSVEAVIKVADGVTKAAEGLGATKEGVKKIEEGINQLKEDKP